MALLIDIFGFLSVVLRGLELAFEALVVGGVIFLTLIARTTPGDDLFKRLTRWLTMMALSLAAVQAASLWVNSEILLSSTDLGFGDITGANFWMAGVLVIAGALVIAVLCRGRIGRITSPIACAMILGGAVMASHSVGRLDDRAPLVIVTLLHHLSGAAWVGGLPYLLIALRHTDNRTANGIVGRFSTLAMVSVAVVVGAGLTLGVVYTGSLAAVGATTYGAMLTSKVLLTLVLMGLGALNLKIVRAIRRGESPSLLPLRRFSEAEVGIGITVLLAAASLTSTPPAVDVVADRVAPAQIADRMTPRWPRLETPPLSSLTPAPPLDAPGGTPATYVPGQTSYTSSPSDKAWSEYNHHWAGIVVLAVGLLALLARWFRWARHWPLAFLGLAVFLLIRADAENWPLGPRGFWESFVVAEVAQHRLFVLLIVAFAVFEWSVRNNLLSPARAGLVFPLVCAIGGALLLTHSHSIGNVKEEYLAELSHLPLAVFGVLAGWCRWLEIRLPAERTRLVANVWPVCFVLIGAVLLLYRES